MFAQLSSQQQIAEWAVGCTRAGAAHIKPLSDAVLAGWLRLCITPPGGRIPLRLLDMDRDRRPLVVILGGDMEPAARPSDFLQTTRLMKWARFIMVHAAGGDAMHYSIACEAARNTRRVLLVETTTAMQRAWMTERDRLAPKTPAFLIEVPPGQHSHPNEAAPAGTVFQ